MVNIYQKEKVRLLKKNQATCSVPSVRLESKCCLITSLVHILQKLDN